MSNPVDILTIVCSHDAHVLVKLSSKSVRTFWS